MSQKEYEILSFGSFEKQMSPTLDKGQDLILDSHEGDLPVIGVADGASQGRGDLAKVIVAEEFEKWRVDLKPGIDVIAAIESFVSRTQDRLLKRAKETRDRSVETTLSLVLPDGDRVYMLNIGENICSLFDYDDAGNHYKPRGLMGAYGSGSDARMHLGSILFKPGNLVQKGYLKYFGTSRGDLYRAVLATDGVYGIEGGKSEFLRLSRDKPAEEVARQLKAGSQFKAGAIMITQTDDMAFIGADLKYKN